MNPLFVIVGLLCLSVSLQAAEIDQDSEVLATRGKGVVTQGVFTARAEKIRPNPGWRPCAIAIGYRPLLMIYC